LLSPALQSPDTSNRSPGEVTSRSVVDDDVATEQHSVTAKQVVSVVSVVSAPPAALAATDLAQLRRQNAELTARNAAIEQRNAAMALEISQMRTTRAQQRKDRADFARRNVPTADGEPMSHARRAHLRAMSWTGATINSEAYAAYPDQRWIDHGMSAARRRELLSKDTVGRQILREEDRRRRTGKS